MCGVISCGWDYRISEVVSLLAVRRGHSIPRKESSCVFRQKVVEAVNCVWHEHVVLPQPRMCSRH